MRKDITLVFGYTGNDIDELMSTMSEKLDIELTPTSGDYIGLGFSFFGKDERFDSLRSSSNYLPEDDWWRNKDNKDCQLLLSFSFTKGKNKDKEDKASIIKKLMSEVKNIKELDYNIYVHSNSN